MAFVNYVILDGQHFVIKEEKHIVELLIMPHHRFYKDKNMTCQ